jgi:hypothetical protein
MPLSIFTPPGGASLVTISGNFEAITGIGNGYVVVELVNFGGNPPCLSGTGIIVNPKCTSLPGQSFELQVYGNDSITPDNTYYQVSFYDCSNNLISSALYQFTGALSYDLSTCTPVTVAENEPLGLAAVAYSGSWNDLNNRPAIITADNANTFTAAQTFQDDVTAPSVNGTPIPGHTTLMTPATAVAATQMPALSGDVTSAAGGTATTVVKINGGAIPASAKAIATDGSGKPIAATLAGSGAGLTTGPTSGTANAHVAVFADAAGTLKDPGLPVKGTGAAISTGPATSTTGDLVAYADTNCTQYDSGVAVSTVMQKTTPLAATQLPALTGDVTSTAGSAATTVGAIKGAAVPALAAGYLHSDGTNLAWQTPGAVTQIGVVGAFRNLKSSATGSSASIAVSADELILETSSNAYMVARAISLTINSAASGANGLDTGTLAASTWYSLWVISDGTNVAGLISTSSTAPTLPGAYTYKARVGWIRTDASTKYPLAYLQVGRKVQYMVTSGSNLTALPQIASGGTGSYSTPTYSAVATTSFVPPTAASMRFVAYAPGGSSVESIISATNATGSSSTTTNPPYAGGASYGRIQGELLLASGNASSIYVATNSSAYIACTGWEDSL